MSAHSTHNNIVKVIDLVPGAVRPVETVAYADLDADTFWNEYVCKHRPLVIKGAAADWAAAQKWHDTEYLEQLSAGHKPDVWLGRTFNPHPAPTLAEAMSYHKLSECLRMMREAGNDETLSMPAVAMPEQWAGDVGQFNFVDKRRMRKPRGYPGRRLFIYRNASTEWHFHPTDETLTTQCAGTKRMSFIRLDRANWENASTLIYHNIHHLKDAARFFPDSLKLTKHEAVLEPGDTIYIPPYWWHGVDPADSEFGITLAECFRTPWSRFGDWQEPAIELMFKLCSKRHGVRLSAELTLSMLVRLFKGEKWVQDSWTR